jgi:predicted XRE-type DNA-binding protein
MASWLNIRALPCHWFVISPWSEFSAMRIRVAPRVLYPSARSQNPINIEIGSGNVFADVWLPRPEQELLKAKLTLEIYRILRERELKQAEAGKILGIKQPHVSLLMRNRAGTFSVERLMDFLTALGQDVKITVKPAKGKLGKVSLAA